MVAKHMIAGTVLADGNLYLDAEFVIISSDNQRSEKSTQTDDLHNKCIFLSLHSFQVPNLHFAFCMFLHMSLIFSTCSSYLVSMMR